MKTGRYRLLQIKALFRPTRSEFEKGLLIFQKGVLVVGMSGVSVHDFLSGSLKLTAPYIDERIRTVFFNGKPVDDLRAQTLACDSVIALSGAMPGLVGAIFRRESAYKVFREGISFGSETGIESPSERCLVTLKLFNNVIAEVGPLLLSRGIYLNAEDFFHYLSAVPMMSVRNLEKLFVNEEKRPASYLDQIRTLEKNQLIEVSVVVD